MLPQADMKWFFTLRSGGTSQALSAGMTATTGQNSFTGVSEISNLKSQISNLEPQISNLKSQILNLKSQISDLRSQISNWCQEW